MLRTMIFLLAMWAVLVYIATACSTVEEYDGGLKYGPRCTTRIELRNGTKLEYPTDMDHLVRAEEGCVRHYGNDYCLTKFIKTGHQSYWAICGRAK